MRGLCRVCVMMNAPNAHGAACRTVNALRDLVLAWARKLDRGGERP
jgi:hypothetical protein